MNVLDVALQAVGPQAPPFRVFPVHGILRAGTAASDFLDAVCTCGFMPCKNAGKHPMIDDWQGQATRDPEQIKRWWAQWPEANVGYVADADAGVWVIDLDGAEGEGAFAKLLAARPLTVGLHVVTPSGGRHIYMSPAPGVRNSQGKITKGIDVRGNGGYVVGPGSLGKNGVRYAYVNYGAPLNDGQWGLWAIAEGWKLFAADPAGKPRRAGAFRLPDVIVESGGNGTEGRHTTLMRYACSLRAKGQVEDEILAAVRAANLERCVPPEDDGAIIYLVTDICRRYPAGMTALPQYDECGLVERIQRELEMAGGAPLVATRGDVYAYDGGVWLPLGVEGVASFLNSWKNELYLDGKGAERKFRPILRQMNSVHGQLVLLDHNERFFDKPTAGCAFFDAFLTADGHVIDHSPGHRQRHRLDVRLADVWPALCPNWLRFLDQTFAGTPDKAQRITLLQEIFGAILCGLGPRYQKGFLLFGGGANGKSVVTAGQHVAVILLAERLWRDAARRAGRHEHVLGHVGPSQRRQRDVQPRAARV